MEKIIYDLLNDWTKFSGYDREKNNFNAHEYEINKMGKKAEKLLQEYDDSGMLSVISLKNGFLKLVDNLQVSLIDILKNKNDVKKEIEEYQDLYNRFYSKEILEYEDIYYRNIMALIEKIVGRKLIADKASDDDSVKKRLTDCTDKVMNGLEKCNVHIFQKGAMPVGKITKFATQIYVFPSIAQCLLALDNATDGIYLTYIDVANSPDSFFGFFIKNNGNIFSYDERIDEAYRGSHQHSRNGRWSENKADEIFPYDFIFHYSAYDHKGYSMNYQIDEEKLQFFQLGEEVYLPLLLAMVFVARKFSNKELEGEELFVDSMLPANITQLADNASGTELAVIEKNAIVERHKNINLFFDAEKVIKGEYENEAKEYGLNSSEFTDTKLFIELYGEGFSFDINELVGISDTLMLTDSKYSYMPEFLGSEKAQRRQVYYEIRKKLAEHIKKKMHEEYANFGGIKAYKEWFKKVVNENIEKIEEIIAKRYDADDFQMAGWGTADMSVPFNVYLEQNKTYPSGMHLGYCPSASLDGWKHIYNDARTGTKCTIFAIVKPKDWNGLELLFGEIPKLVKGWRDVGHYTNGNSILSAVDFVENIGTPFEYNERIYDEAKRENSTFDFSIAIGYSKRGFAKMLNEHGFQVKQYAKKDNVHE